MDFCRNVSVSGEYIPEKVVTAAEFSMHNGAYSSSYLDDVFPIQHTEGDVSLEWLSAFMEDCLSSTGNCVPFPTNPPPTQQQQQRKQPEIPETVKPFDEKAHRTSPSLHLPEFSIPGKARSKRKRTPSTKTQQPFTYSDPPLLHQAYWLADSELMVTKKPNNNGQREETSREEEEQERMVDDVKDNLLGNYINNDNNVNMGQQQGRRCTHCLSQKTPQWRAGPLGPKTLCNACGVRFKSGRLLPEYRPAKSPTFVSYKHSNSHKKVMEMRMSVSLD